MKVLWLLISDIFCKATHFANIEQESAQSKDWSSCGMQISDEVRAGKATAEFT